MAIVAGSVGSGHAAVVFTENFNVNDTANWTVNASTGASATDTTADFFYDYSTIGVPAAPGGTGTRGLKMTANNTGGVFGGLTVSPTGESFAGSYVVRFDLWSNYAGPLGVGGSGSTQISTYGVLTGGTSTQWIGSATKESISFANTLDGGSAADYRAYAPLSPTSYPGTSSVYAAPLGAINNSDAYYGTAFPSIGAPAAQLALFPGQTGVTDSGESAFRWVNVSLTVDPDNVVWAMNGTTIATVPRTGQTTGGNNIFFGHSDTNATSSTDANDSLLNVTLIDNIVVETIPEPGSLLLLGLGFGSLLGRRQRR